MKRENYEGQIFGTRKIIRNYCEDSDWLSIGKKVPNEKSKYRLSECLCCGRLIPVLINKLKSNPPKKCSFCSGINCQSTITDRNSWTQYQDYCVLNIIFNDTVISCYIDKEDYEAVSKKIWRIVKKKQKYYVISGSKGSSIYLHQFILNETIPQGYEIDHIDGNSLNNRHNNLRIVSRLENIQNSQVRIDNKIGIRGIAQVRNKFQVDFSFNHIRYYFPKWNSLEEAVYCRLFTEEHFGLQILLRNPLATSYLNLPEEEQLKIKKIVLDNINSVKAPV